MHVLRGHRPGRFLCLPRGPVRGRLRRRRGPRDRLRGLGLPGADLWRGHGLRRKQRVRPRAGVPERLGLPGQPAVQRRDRRVLRAGVPDGGVLDRARGRQPRLHEPEPPRRHRVLKRHLPERHLHAAE